MKGSMRARLFLILIVTTGIVWLSAVAWIFYNTRSQVEHVLDARLMEAANMVSALMVKQDLVVPQSADLTAKDLWEPRNGYERQLSCQIWSFEGNLISKSDTAPATELTAERTGYSETVINGEPWRVYAVENAELGVRVLVGDSLSIRNELVGNVIKGLLLPALLIMPILAGLIWLSVRSGLAPLNRMADSLSSRSASDFSPLPNENATVEIRPVIGALNDLFRRVADARERERNFTSFAAHELRTPLAGLKTQAQVALASNDPDIREKALSQIVQGVNRTGRLVRQLLDLAAVESQGAEIKVGVVNPGETLDYLRSELLAHTNEGIRVSIEDALFSVRISMNADLFTLAARNLLENAILHTKPGGTVACRLWTSDEFVSVSIDDEGPGIPAEEISQVTERFFRGRNKTTLGSGLGLSIVELALDHAGARLELNNLPSGGLSANIIVAAASAVISE